MSRAYIPKALRERVHEQARRRCGYCLTAEAIVGAPMEVEHIFPESLGGATEEDNPWLACSLCNDHKNDRIAALDPLDGEIVRLFDPRHQRWALDAAHGAGDTARRAHLVLFEPDGTIILG